MMEALYNGVSGIKTNQFGIDVTGNNIANTNTVGFKNSQAEFKDVFYNTTVVAQQNPVASQVGLGSTVAGTAINFEEGSFQSTDNTFDMAIAGDGFFAVAGVDGSTYYTRAGQFSVDVNRDLVGASGHYLMGTSAVLSDATYSQGALSRLGAGAPTNALTLDLNSNLAFSDTQSKINLPQNLYIPPEPTTQVDFKAILTTNQEFKFGDAPLNLVNATQEVIDNKININGTVLDTPNMQKYIPGSEITITFVNPAGNELQTKTRIQQDGSFGLNEFDISELADETGSTEGVTFSATAQMQIEEPTKAKLVAGLQSSSGYENTLTLNLTRQVPGKIDGADWDVVASITDPQGNELSSASGVLSFNGLGALTSNTLGALSNEGVPLTLNLGSFYDPNVPNSGFDGITMQDKPTQTTAVQTDGRKDGVLTNYAMGEDGMIMALFDNGFQAAVARVPLFHFQNDQGLFTEGGVFFSPTSNSGEPFMYAREDGTTYNGAKILGNMLENSNVDIGNEMTMLIIQQRAYEASAKSITTSDQMLQKAINMKN